MEKNLGKTDRIIRAILSIVLLIVGIVLGMGAWSWYAILLVVLGAMIGITAITGFCSLYVPFGLSTLKKKE